jgi:hypothetical protein
MAVAWAVGALSSNFLDLAGQFGSVVAFDTAQIDGPSHTLVTTQAECDQRRRKDAERPPSLSTGTVFCTPGAYSAPIATILLKSWTSLALMLASGCVFWAAMRARAERNPN